MPDKNSENSFGIGVKAYFNNGFTIEGYAGEGKQSVAGKTFSMDSNLNARTFTTDTVRKGHYTAVFNNNTEIVEMGLNLGYNFTVYQKYDLTANLGLLYSANQLSWRVAGGNMDISADQASIGFKF